MYPKVWWYRGAAVLDLFGRFVWLATVVPPNAFGSHLTSYIPDYLTPILALAELARRCVWGFFRLEHEHLSNALSASEGGAIRAVASADLTASESAETRFVGRRDGLHCRSRHCPRVAHDDPRARFGQIGALERDVARTQCVPGH